MDPSSRSSSGASDERNSSDGINFRASYGANLVTQRSKIRTNEILNLPLPRVVDGGSGVAEGVEMQQSSRSSGGGRGFEFNGEFGG